MNDPKSQPGQRNIANQGDRNINASGDNPTFNFYNTPPERSAKHQLRAPVGDFVGRETEITELTAELTNGGQVGISGISGLGGIGKTELALVVANRLLPNYPDAQLMVELRGTDPTPRRAEDALADCVRAFVGIEARLPDDLATLTKLYRDCLTGQRVLVVLDNAADADQVRPFLVPGGCALLVTSRETISLPKMKRIRLEQLPPDKARELLREIAPRVSEPIADQICFLCGYLPLAVRAAASLLDVTTDLDPAEFAAESSDERRRLELKYANAEGHEISVEVSFNLSYARLSEESARVFRSLSVFPASFDAAAEETICQDAGHKCLSELLRRNLVIFDEAERRYRLHDLARAFADSQLDQSERDALNSKHFLHFYTVLIPSGKPKLESHEQVMEWIALIVHEQANLAVLIDRMPKPPESRFQEVGFSTCYSGTEAEMISLHLSPLELTRWMKLLTASAWGASGLTCVALGDEQNAIESYEQCLECYRNIGDLLGEGIALWNMGLALNRLGDRESAIANVEAALTIFEAIESPYAARVRAQLAEWRK